MPRIRTIKPEFWTSAQVLECSPTARLLFIGLWNFADDCGRHVDNPKQVKAEIFPADDILSEDIRGMLDELERNKLIFRYTVDDVDILQVTGWKHQRIDKPQPSRFPGPNGDRSENDRGTFVPEGRGGEGKGGEGKGKDSRGGRVDDKSPNASRPDDISPVPAHSQESGANGSARRDERPFETIKDHVKDLVTRFETQDVSKLHKLGGRSMRLTPKQITAAIQQLREDREI